MSFADELPRLGWNAAFGFWRWWFHYTVAGLATLAQKDEGFLVVGYHGRPLAWDMCILQTELCERLGYLPAGMLHPGIAENRLTKWFFLDGLGFVVARGDALAAHFAAKRHLFITPGAAREGCRSAFDHHAVEWGDEVGFVRIALQQKVRIVPVGASGTDDAYVGLTNAEDLATALGVSRTNAYRLWLGLGPIGLYPFSPPFRTRIHQEIGAPIDFRDRGVTVASPREKLEELAHEVRAAVQAQVDRARERAGRAR